MFIKFDEYAINNSISESKILIYNITFFIRIRLSFNAASENNNSYCYQIYQHLKSCDHMP